MKIRVYDIHWETDGIEVDLPAELNFDVEDHESV